jgi:hypothetical protein
MRRLLIVLLIACSVLAPSISAAKPRLATGHGAAEARELMQRVASNPQIQGQLSEGDRIGVSFTNAGATSHFLASYAGGAFSLTPSPTPPSDVKATIAATTASRVAALNSYDFTRSGPHLLKGDYIVVTSGSAATQAAINGAIQAMPSPGSAQLGDTITFQGFTGVIEVDPRGSPPVRWLARLGDGEYRVHGEGWLGGEISPRHFSRVPPASGFDFDVDSGLSSGADPSEAAACARALTPATSLLQQLFNGIQMAKCAQGA